MALTPPPLSLYVHFPWCVRKCPYCDFNSHTLSRELPEDRYIEALLRDMESQAPDVAGRPLISIFMGGGTPSLFSADGIARVLAHARACFGFTADVEITLEANPGTIERGRFAEYREAGVNRVSLGAQSFDASRLKALGRIHTPDDTCRAAEELHAAGIENFNLDLMYALPGQDVAGASSDIEQALALRPAHISHYQLTIEPGTVFFAHTPELPDDETAADMLAACQQRLAEAGFSHYETSAYARPGRMSVHNRNYWLFGDYVGIGAGAHGKITTPEGIYRTVHLREPRRYMAAATQPTKTRVAEADLPFEFMMNALRLLDGFDKAQFTARTGLGWERIADRMRELADQGLIELTTSRVRPTPLGARFLNDMLVRLLPDHSEALISGAV